MTDYQQTGSDATTITAASRASLTPQPEQISAFHTGPQAFAQMPDPSRMDTANLIFNPNATPAPNPGAFAFFGDSLNQPKQKPLFSSNYG